MARKIDFQKDLSEDDRHYMVQRPWMVREYEIQTGKSFDAPDPGFHDSSQPVNKEDAEYLSRLETQVEQLRLENSSLRESNETLQTQLDRAVDEMDELQKAAARAVAGTDEDDDEEDDIPPYSEWEYSSLQSEIADRNKDREEDDQIKPSGRKTEDLIRALEADDNAAEEREANAGE